MTVLTQRWTKRWTAKVASHGAMRYTWAVLLQRSQDRRAVDRDASFGRLLKRLRKARDLTQDALAQQAYCALDTIKKIEAGVRRPSRQLAEILAELLALEGVERAAFLQAARGELGRDRLTAPQAVTTPTAVPNSRC